MRKSAAFFATVLLLCAASAPAQVKTRSPENDQETARRFGRLLEGLREDLKIPGLSAAIVSGGGLLWTEGFGYADIDKKIKAAPDTSYYLASLPSPSPRPSC